MNIHDSLKEVIQSAIKSLGFPEMAFVVEHPDDFSHGDYFTNIAMIVSPTIHPVRRPPIRNASMEIIGNPIMTSMGI